MCNSTVNGLLIVYLREPVRVSPSAYAMTHSITGLWDGPQPQDNQNWPYCTTIAFLRCNGIECVNWRVDPPLRISKRRFVRNDFINFRRRHLDRRIVGCYDAWVRSMKRRLNG